MVLSHFFAESIGKKINLINNRLNEINFNKTINFVLSYSQTHEGMRTICGHIQKNFINNIYIYNI